MSLEPKFDSVLAHAIAVNVAMPLSPEKIYAGCEIARVQLSVGKPLKAHTQLDSVQLWAASLLDSYTVLALAETYADLGDCTAAQARLERVPVSEQPGLLARLARCFFHKGVTAAAWVAVREGELRAMRQSRMSNGWEGAFAGNFWIPLAVARVVLGDVEGAKSYSKHLPTPGLQSLLLVKVAERQVAEGDQRGARRTLIQVLRQIATPSRKRTLEPDTVLVMVQVVEVLVALRDFARAKQLAGYIAGRRWCSEALRCIAEHQALWGLFSEAQKTIAEVTETFDRTMARLALCREQARQGNVSAAKTTLQLALRSRKTLSETEEAAIQEQVALIHALCGDVQTAKAQMLALPTEYERVMGLLSLAKLLHTKP